MNISVCITTLNEEGTITKLLEGLFAGTKRPDEVVIVDAGSTDRTIEIIRHFQKKDNRIKLLVEKGVSRARGRNIAVELSKGDVIAMTDAGCIPTKYWLERIISPFPSGVDVVAGFYKMKA